MVNSSLDSADGPHGRRRRWMFHVQPRILLSIANFGCSSPESKASLKPTDWRTGRDGGYWLCCKTSDEVDMIWHDLTNEVAALWWQELEVQLLTVDQVCFAKAGKAIKECECAGAFEQKWAFETSRSNLHMAPNKIRLPCLRLLHKWKTISSLNIQRGIGTGK